MDTNIDALAAAAKDLLVRSIALLGEENPHPVPISTVRAIKQDLQLTMAAVGKHYNSSPSAPIHRLHPEILGMIFRHIRTPSEPATPASPEKSRFDSYKPLLALMLVCHKWHRLIFEDAALWTEIDVIKGSTAMAKCLIERSKGASLDVRLAYPAFKRGGRNMVTAFLKDNAHRFRQLEVKYKSMKRISKLLPLLDHSMPRLTCLVVFLAMDNYRGLPTPATTGNVHTMSFTGFPVLKALAVSGTLLRPKGRASIPSLTHLHIVGVGFESILPLMDMLRAASSLEVLDLRVVRLSTQGVSPGSSSLTLPHLRVLRITQASRSGVVHFILSRIVSPSLEFVEIAGVDCARGRMYESQPYIPQSFLNQRIMTRLSLEDDNTFHAAFVSASSNNVFILQERFRAPSVLTTPPMLTWLGDIEEVCYRSNGDMRPLRNGLWLAEHLPQVKSLTIGATDWQRGLRLLRRDEPVLFPLLASCTIGLPSLHRSDIDDIARILEKRAQIARPIPIVRIAVDVPTAEGQLELHDKVGKHVGALEVVQSTHMWPAWYTRPASVGEHGYWADSNIWHLDC